MSPPQLVGKLRELGAQKFYGMVVPQIGESWAVSNHGFEIGSFVLRWKTWVALRAKFQRAKVHFDLDSGHWILLPQVFQLLRRPMLHGKIRFVRLFRTESSERFIAQIDELDIAAIDLHFLANGQVAGTVVIISTEVSDSSVAALLKRIDDDLLPERSIESGSVSFAVVRGTLVGNFVPESEAVNT